MDTFIKGALKGCSSSGDKNSNGHTNDFVCFSPLTNIFFAMQVASF